MGRLICACLLLGCRHPQPVEVPPPSIESRVYVLQDRLGLFAIEPGEGVAREVPGFEDLFSYLAVQRGPYVTFERQDVSTVIDLRDLEGGTQLSEELRVAIEEATSISTAPGDTTIVRTIDGEITVTTVAPDAALAPRTIASPVPNVVSLVVSPDGATLALVGGPAEDGDQPQDLFTIRVRDGETRRWTDAGDVIDVAFVDDATVMFVREQNDAFNTLELASGTIDQIPVPDGWFPELLDAYVGWEAGAMFDHDTSGTAPLLPVRESEWSHALLDPGSGERIALQPDELLVAVAPDGASVLVTHPCDGTGKLVWRFRDGFERVIRAAPPKEACAASEERDTVRVSAAFSSDGRVVYAVPHGEGWRVSVEDPDGGARTVLDAPSPVRVLGY